jgi:Uncharacterized conserved protein
MDMHNMEVPQALASLPQWVNWRIENGRKVPINPATGRKAKSNTPATWTSLTDAQATGEQLGFVFATDGGLFGVDLDGCIVDGEVQPWAIEVLERLPTYSEISPSRTGIKIYGRGKVPSERGKKRSVPDARQCADKAAAIEAYDHGRFFAFTGEHWPESPREIMECQAGLDWVFAKYWPEQVRELIVVHQPRAVECTGSELEDRARKYLATMPPAVTWQSRPQPDVSCGVCPGGWGSLWSWKSRSGCCPGGISRVSRRGQTLSCGTS